MKSFLILLLISFLVILAFDTFASFTSKIFQTKYALFTIGSVVIYFCVGFFAAKYGNFGLAIIAAAIAGIFDSTLGWYISWLIGPGRIEGEINSTIIFSTIIFVIFMAVFFGLIGGATNYFINR